MKRGNVLSAILMLFVAGSVLNARAGLVVKDCSFKPVSLAGEKWGELRVRYTTQTSTKWLNRLTIDFYLATLPAARTSGLAKPQATLFHKRVTYVDIADGNNEAVTFLHFNPLKRYFPSASKGKYAVVFSIDGRVVAVLDSEKKPETKWWENPEFLTKDGYLMSRDDSPFYSLSPSLYEMIEPKGR